MGGMKDPHSIILRPHITERTVALSYGDPNLDPNLATRKYTFVVDPAANKIEIKRALEAIYNEGRKKQDHIEVESVRTITVKGHTRRVGRRVGKTAGFKKAIVTLRKGQQLQDYGV